MSKIPVIFGISGPILTEEEKEFFKHKNIYGFILFKRNIKSEQQLLELIYELRSSVIGDVIVFTDEEGGKVSRVEPPLTDYTYPSAGYFASVYKQFSRELAIELVEQNYKNIMLTLKKFSIDITCAPVADLRLSGANLVIGERSFMDEVSKNDITSYDIDQVIDLCKAAINGIRNVGGKGVIKHIPGHGRAVLDSHLALPVVTTSLEELMQTDFAVFKALSEYLDETSYAMTAHIIYDALDPTTPATLSNKVIEFIRREIGFKGNLITDDICMKALHRNIDLEDPIAYSASLGNVAHQAILQGCDIVLHCSGVLAEMEVVYYALEFPITEV